MEAESGLAMKVKLVKEGVLPEIYMFLFLLESMNFLQEKGDDIYFDVPIKLTTAALGGHVDIPTIDGTKARLKIPEGTQHDDPFRLKSKGMNIMNSGGRRGNMFVKAKIEVPVNISKKERELLEELDQLISNKKNSPNSESFFKKMGDFLAKFSTKLLLNFHYLFSRYQFN